ncbi:cadherin domain-containing protein [Pontiellaceae bacterium B12227]|nr:cadherin domain-containing protein [Pontiellaceae bacterium B12227]
MKSHGLQKYMIRFGLIGILSCLGIAQGQTLTGYTNTGSLPNYNADGAYALLDEWMGLIDPNLDVLPSARETEIYQELVKGERSISRVTSFDFNNKWANDGMYIWGSASTIENCRTRIELAKDLAWLPSALDHTDEMLALRDPAGTYSLNLGRNLLEPIWLSPHDWETGRISPLNSGHNGTYVARFANWILEHPELYAQTAPSNSVIPLTVPTIYYERAKFYLTEMKKTINEEHNAGFFWEFDTTTQSGWIFQGDGALSGSDLAALYPGGIPVANILSVSNSEGISLHPYNRTLFFIAAHMETAKGLALIDAHEGTSVHTAFINRAYEINEKCLNYWRHHRLTHVEAEPNGTSVTWPYGGNQNQPAYEDTVHFEMDIDPLSSLKEAGLLSSNDLTGVTGSIYSRWFDHESHVYYNHQGRYVGTHAVTGLPNNFYWWWGLGRSDWMGESATPAQMQGYAMKSLEVFRERMRRASVDLSFREQYLGRDDTRRSRTMMGPFQLYDLKMARQARGLTPTGGSNAPVIQSVSPSSSFSVSESTPLGTVIGSVTATDVDAGQTLHYWISGGNIGNRFKINPTNGTIRVNNYYALNDEEGASTPLEITVIDDGVPMKMATTTVHISLDDTNASPLVPAGQTGRFTKNLIKGDPVMTVNATDASDLRFFIETGTTLFSIDSDTGIIRIKDSAVAASSPVGNTYTLQIGVMETSALPLTTRQTVEITCEASFGNATASVSSGTVPFSVNFNSTHDSGTVVSTAWDFADGGSALAPSASHTYTMAGTYTIHALIRDARGEIDRKTLQVVASGAGGTIPDGLLAHYRFSEGSGTTAIDSSGNSNHAALSGDAYDADAPVATGFELRDEVLTIPSAVYSALSDEITISFFLRGDADFHPYNTFLRASDSSGNRVLSAHMPWGGEGGSYIWDAGNVGSSFNRVQSSAPIPAAGEWNHWVLTKNANTGSMAMYTNGVLLVSANSKTFSMNDITSFKFGGGNYRGTIDEIQIYDKALDAAEVVAVYSALSVHEPVTLVYTAGANGMLTGMTTQTVSYAGNGSAVEAVPDSGYVFAEWSDGRTDNPRTDLLVTGDLSVSATFSTAAAGLWYGTVSGDINITDPNPQTGVTMNLGETEDSIGANTTEIYSGEVYDADGNISFTEDIDDKVRLYIDGVLVLNSDNYWDRTSTGNLNLSPGWHTFELRISNGGGGSGPYSSPGFGYDPDGGSNWIHPEDPGDASLFRHAVASELTLTADVANSSPSGYSGSVANTVNDPFAYDSDAPVSALPEQTWDSSAGYHASLGEGIDAVLVYQLAGTAGDLVVDLYGRNLAGAVERDNNIDIKLYSGGLGGTLVEQVTGLAIPDSAPYYARATLSPAAAFDTLVVIGHDATSASGNAFTLMEIRAALSQVSDPDTDGDGLTDAQEIALGTNPNDPDSGFGIDGSLPMYGKIQLSWPSATGVLYKVWKSPDLTSWSVARGWSSALTPPIDTLEVDLTPSNGYFKVEAQIQ